MASVRGYLEGYPDVDYPLGLLWYPVVVHALVCWCLGHRLYEGVKGSVHMERALGEIEW